MTTDLVPYEDMIRMAKALADSKLFGIKDPQQALAMMLVAQAEGLHPASVAVDYDFIQGRPAKKPTAMLRDFTKAGGKVDWHRLDDTTADATFSHPQGGRVRVVWTLDKARRAQLLGKEMWIKYPAAMLRSRCVSEGMRAVYPGATGGLYTPEEIQDMDPIRTEIDVTPTAAAPYNDALPSHELPAVDDYLQPMPREDFSRSPPESVVGEPRYTPPPQQPQPSGANYATKKQQSMIYALLKKNGIDQEYMLREFDFTDLAHIPFDRVNDVLKWMGS